MIFLGTVKTFPYDAIFQHRCKLFINRRAEACLCRFAVICHSLRQGQAPALHGMDILKSVYITILRLLLRKIHLLSKGGFYIVILNIVEAAICRPKRFFATAQNDIFFVSYIFSRIHQDLSLRCNNKTSHRITKRQPAQLRVAFYFISVLFFFY